MKKTEQELRALGAAIRRDVLEMTYHAGVNGGHIGGALSCADILAVLYGEVMDISASDPANPLRDRFLLSKGHVALAHYAVLAETGFISRDELREFEQPDGKLPTHEVMDVQRGIEISSGSLGYGLSIGVGCALSAKKRRLPYRTYVLLGDGECNEGTVWEACMAAVKFGLDNLKIIVDINRQSLDGFIESTMPVQDFNGVFTGFGCHVVEVDGHDPAQIATALAITNPGKPTVLLAHTIKGKGIPSIENKTGWHHARLTEEQYQSFKQELEAANA